MAARIRTESPPPLHWDGTSLQVLDQTRLPAEEVVVTLTGAQDTAEAIKRLAVRGAPLIGVAAAYGLAMAVAADPSLPTLERAADAAEKLSGEGLDEVRSSREALLEARGQADELIAAAERAQKALDRASDNVEAALARAEPLQGLAERVGRLSERLPGGGRPPEG